MKIIYSIIALVVHFITFAQEDNPIFGTVLVTYSSNNSIDDSDYSQINQRYLLFEQKGESIDFINVIVVKNTYSIGKVNNLKIENVNRFYTIYHFNWEYSNSYDDKTGKAKVKLEIHKRTGEEKYDQAIVTLTDSEGLNISYKGGMVYNKNEFVFHYLFKKATDNKELKQ